MSDQTLNPIPVTYDPPPSSPSSSAVPALVASHGAPVSASIPVTYDPPPATGVAAGASRFIHGFPTLVHALVDNPTDDHEQAIKDNHGQIGLISYRLLEKPLQQEEAESEAYQRVADQNPTASKALTADNLYNGPQEMAFMHKITQAVPLIGPIAGQLVDRYLSGDKSGALAELALNVGTEKAAGAAGDLAGKVPGALGDAASAGVDAIRSSPKVAAIGKTLQTISTSADPDVVGLVSPRLAHAQNLAGKVGRVINKVSTAPDGSVVTLPDNASSTVRGVGNLGPVQGTPNATVGVPPPPEAAGPAVASSPVTPPPTPPPQASSPLNNPATAATPAREAAATANVGRVANTGINNTPSVQANPPPVAVAPPVQANPPPVAAPSNPPIYQPPAKPSPFNYSPEEAKLINDAVDQAIPPSGSTLQANVKAKAEAHFYMRRNNFDAASESIQKNAANIPASTKPAVVLPGQGQSLAPILKKALADYQKSKSGK